MNHNKDIEYLIARGPTIVLNNLNKIQNKIVKTLDETLNLDLKRFVSPSEIMIAADFYEKEDAYVIDIDLPGMAVEDIEITSQEDKLIVRGERKRPDEPEVEKKTYIHQCVGYGKFEREFEVAGMDENKIKASYKNGVLNIVINKTKENKTKKIKIEAEHHKTQNA